MDKALALLLLLLILPTYALNVHDTNRKGYYLISIDGVVQEEQYSLQRTALDAAINIWYACPVLSCEVRVIQPEIEVTGKREAVVAVTADATLEWALPTQREDETFLAAGDLVKATVYHRLGDAGEVVTTDVSISQLTLGFDSLVAGEHQFAVTVTDNGGLESKLSALVKLEI